jgi:hypothetical protein
MKEMEDNARKTGNSAILYSNAGVFQRGDVFEAKTVKGGTNYIIFLFTREGWTYYCHGDKGKKVRSEKFKALIDYGDLVPIPKEKRDPERMSLAVLGLMAMDNGLAFNDYMKVAFGYGDGSQATELAKN